MHAKKFDLETNYKIRIGKRIKETSISFLQIIRQELYIKTSDARGYVDLKIKIARF
jgi:hypothetical protein